MQSPKSAAASPPSPRSFPDIVEREGFHGVYVVSNNCRGITIVKVGTTTKTASQLKANQQAYFNREVKVHGVWWTPGQPIAARIEKAVKEHAWGSRLAGWTGDWFKLPPQTVCELVAAAAKSIPIRIFTQEQLLIELATTPETHWSARGEHFT